MREAIEAPTDAMPDERLRDGLLVAIGVCTGLRRRNLTEMRLGHNLIRRKSGWEIIFDEGDMKNNPGFLSRPLAALDPFIERYLHVNRPRLLAARAADCDGV